MMHWPTHLYDQIKYTQTTNYKSLGLHNKKRKMEQVRIIRLSVVQAEHVRLNVMWWTLTI